MAELRLEINHAISQINCHSRSCDLKSLEFIKR